MLKKIAKSELFNDNYGWLSTYHHFSFGRYYNPKKMNFGALRVINNDYIVPHTGFDTHPHKNMEIITYVVKGKLTHRDSLMNTGEITRGEIQYMSAGKGIEHSEHNLHDEVLHLYQIWILPEKKELEPNYGEKHFNWDERIDKLFHMVSSVEGTAPIKIHQDMNIYSTYTDKEFLFEVKNGRQAYIILIEGEANIGNEKLWEGDSIESIEESIIIKPKQKSHLLLFEMKKGD